MRQIAMAFVMSFVLQYAFIFLCLEFESLSVLVWVYYKAALMSYVIFGLPEWGSTDFVIGNIIFYFVPVMIVSLMIAAISYEPKKSTD